MKKINVFDLDGTLADSTHRYRLIDNEKRIDLPHWRENSTPLKIIADKPIQDMIKKYNDSLSDPHAITVIATARIFDHASMVWLLENTDGRPDHISSRIDEDDQRSGNSIKGEFIKALRSTLGIFHAVFFTDDNINYLRQFKITIPDATVIYKPSDQGY